MDAIHHAVYCAHRCREASPEADRRKLAADMSDRLQSIVISIAPATRSHHEAWLAVAEIGIRYGTVERSKLVDPLSSLVAAASDPQTQGRGRAWLLVVIADDPEKEAVAAELLAEIGHDQTLLAIVEQGLATLVRRSGTATDRVKKLRLQAIDSALSLSLDEQKSTHWLNQRSEALADLQRFESALAVLIKLEQKFPQDAGIQLRIARLLTRVFGQQEPAKPLAKWRQLASQLKPHSPNWYEAKYKIASLLEQSGQHDEACKLLEFLKAVPPGWEQSKLKLEFERLLAKCKSS